jgi:hypothetical protein
MAQKLARPACTLMVSKLPEMLSNDTAGTEITNALICVMGEEVLPIELRPLLTRLAEGSVDGTGTAEEFQKLFQLLDDQIIFQTESMGHRILLSPLVSWRLKVWIREREGFELYERWVRALVRYNKYMHRRGPLPPVSLGMRLAKADAVNELRLLLKLLPLDRTTKKDKLALEFKKLARERNCSEITRNLDSWLLFIQKKPGALRTHRRSPGSLFDLWLSFTTGHTPTYIRQLVSEKL